MEEIAFCGKLIVPAGVLGLISHMKHFTCFLYLSGCSVYWSHHNWWVSPQQREEEVRHVLLLIWMYLPPYLGGHWAFEMTVIVAIFYYRFSISFPLIIQQIVWHRLK